MKEICGYAVVRKPEFAQNKLRIDGKMYRGINRLPWEDFAAAAYSERLPPHLRSIWQQLKNSNRDLSGIDLLKSYESALAVRDFSGEGSEIVAIWSAELAEVKGTVKGGAGMELLGLDCVAFGEWSVLLRGVYAKPSCFDWAIDRLNDRGLLSSKEECERVFRRYVELSADGTVEPLANEAIAMNLEIYAEKR